ncbi:hypothetical protein [Pontibacter roseus]|uniref:hypothetical protein n=1 Tax=Pontibacter roseus TaxID=336989 RepID=UPI00035F97FC|nr:hypothetical protein [Pontibacter roseus]
MSKTATPKASGVSFAALFCMLLFPACSPPVEQEADSRHTDTGRPTEILTVAAIEEPTEAAYFDLIANTSACLGEDLWIGGKVESTDRVALSEAGAVTRHKVYELRDLTATGLNSNSFYTLWGGTDALKAVFDEAGVLRVQLQEGDLQLIPKTGNAPILVAYHAPEQGTQQNDSYGSWQCK